MRNFRQISHRGHFNSLHNINHCTLRKDSENNDTNGTFRGDKGVENAKLAMLGEKIREKERAKEAKKYYDCSKYSVTVVITFKILVTNDTPQNPDVQTASCSPCAFYTFLTVRLQGAQSLLGECRTNPVWLLKPCFTIQALQGWSLAISMR